MFLNLAEQGVMNRQSYQKGSVSLDKNNIWTGRYLDYKQNSDGTASRTHKRVRLGTIVELPTKEHALAKLGPILERLNTKYQISLQKAEFLCLSDKGAIGELVVAIDLMYRGFEVFRNLSPSGPVDLIAMRPNEKAYRVQVKRRVNMRGFGLPAYIKQLNQAYDVLAVVVGAGDVKYYTHNPDFGVPILPQTYLETSKSFENAEIPSETVH